MLDRKKYVIKNKRDKNNEKVNSWYEECKKLHCPYIVIKNRTKYANIEFDHMSMPKGYDKLLRENHKTITDNVLKLIKKYGSENSSIDTNSFIISFRDIPKENAEQLASELFNIIDEIVN